MPTTGPPKKYDWETINKFVMSLPTVMDYADPSYGDIVIDQHELHQRLDTWLNEQD